METSLNSRSKYPIIDHLDIPKEIFANWQEIINLLADIVNVPAALIMRVHADEIEVFVKSQNEKNIYPQGEKAELNTGLYCETVMDTQRQLIVPDARVDSAWKNNPDIALNMISYCGLPLNWPTGEVFGTICVLDIKNNAYSDKYRKLMQRFHDTIQSDLKNVYYNYQ